MDDLRCEEILEVARDLGLDFFDIRFEEVPVEIMNEIAAYGLPIRAQHWSYGKVFDRHRIHGRMGLSKIYEVVLNNDPAYAFMLDTNTAVEKMLIVAHVAAHSDFFKQNACFRGTNRNMVNEAAEHAVRIDRYKQKYGVEAVEAVMDAGFSIDRHIDPHKGLHRDPYPEREVVERERHRDEYAALFPEEDRFSIERAVTGDRLPPQPEKDLLWFLTRYAPLEPWERDVLEMILEESHYFYPQFATKITNEGWASYWHAEVVNAYDGVSAEEMIDFSALHARVVRPGGRFNLNPYYLGYRIFTRIEETWDRRFASGRSELSGREKLFQVRREEDDISLLRNYLTADLVEELGLYAYASACVHEKHGRSNGDDDRCDRCGQIEISSREVDEVVEALLRPRYSYGAPAVVVEEVADGRLRLTQVDPGNGGLDKEYAEKTLEYIHGLWRGPVSVGTVNQRGREIEMVFDDRGFRIYRVTE